MSDWSAKRDPLPDKSDNLKMKAFFKAKYVDKKFGDVAEDSDSSTEKKKKKKKKDKEKKKRAKAQKVESSSEEEKKESSSDDEPIQKKEKAKPALRALGAPPSSAGAKKPVFAS